VTDRDIAYLPLDEIQPDSRNPRAHRSIGDVREAVEYLGFIEPIVRDERTGRLVAGHGRVEVLTAMHAAGQDPPDGVRAENGRWLVPVVVGWGSRSDDDAARALVVLNHTTETGGWDEYALAELLTQLKQETEVGFTATGFRDTDLDAILAKLAQVQAPEDFPEFDENIDTEHKCPSCGYEWSGGT
jgi:ParB-like chromosome segregation protein Spo0J